MVRGRAMAPISLVTCDRRVLGARAPQRLVPPDVAALDPVHVLAGAQHDEDVADAGAAVGDGLVDSRLEGGGATLAEAAVGGDDEARLGVLDPRPQRLRREATEDDRVQGADARAGEHRDDRLRDHRQVDRHPVTEADAEADERVRGPLDLSVQVRVGEGPAVTGLTLEIQGHAFSAPCRDMPVDRVHARVEPPVGEPPRHRCVRPVEHLGERGVPVEQLAGLIRPEGQAIGRSPLVEVGLRRGLRCELGVRREEPMLVQQVLEPGEDGGVDGHGSSGAQRR